MGPKPEVAIYHLDVRFTPGYCCKTLLAPTNTNFLARTCGERIMI
jgi:hypothetical protein